MAITRAEQSGRIAAPPERCFATITDFESYPEWQSAVLEARVLERDTEGRGRIVELVVDAKLRQVSYRLRYHYDEPGRLWWDFVEGDGIEHIDGEYLLGPDGGGTLATYRLGIDVGVPVPGLIAKRLNNELMKRSVAEFRAEAERREATT